MSIRRLIVGVDPSTINVREFCAHHGVSTWFFYDLRRRFDADGEAALAPKSRAAKVVANRTSVDLEDEIVRARKELGDQGLDAGPESIVDRLGTMGVTAPSASTVWRVLDRRGLVDKNPKKAPGRAVRRFAAERANECWQIDATHLQLADGGWVEVLNVVDDCTRLLVASAAHKACTTALSLAALLDGAARHGLPERVLSDNAAVFTALAAPLAALGVATANSRPYHPQTCGKVERFHLTLKRRLAARPALAAIDELQAELDAFRDLYNHHRPHRAIGRRTPSAAWTATAKSGPTDRPLNLDTPTAVTAYPVTEGRVWVAKNIVISVGGRYNGDTITAVRTGPRVDLFHQSSHIRGIAIEPGRTRYPLA